MSNSDPVVSTETNLSVFLTSYSFRVSRTMHSRRHFVLYANTVVMKKTLSWMLNVVCRRQSA